MGKTVRRQCKTNPLVTEVTTDWSDDLEHQALMNNPEIQAFMKAALAEMEKMAPALLKAINKPEETDKQKSQ